MKREDVTPLPRLVMAVRSKMSLTQRTWPELVVCGYWTMATDMVCVRWWCSHRDKNEVDALGCTSRLWGI